MFDNSEFPKSLDEETFQSWLENGRESRINYNYLLIIWNAQEQEYSPVYLEGKAQIAEYDQYGMSYGAESLVAAYDLYSESRILSQQ